MAQHQQQDPRPGIQDVTPALIADLQERSDRGLETYGRRLQTFNGRNALQDALEEALDLAQYLKQSILEQAARRYRWVKIVSPAVCYMCRCLVEADEGTPRDVILDDDQGEGIVALFCGLDCANLKEDDQGRVVEKEPSSPKAHGSEMEHQGTRAFRHPNGSYSGFLLECGRCGASYDPTFLATRKGCRGF